MPVEDGIMTLGEQLIAVRAKDKKWYVKAQKEARRVFAMLSARQKSDSE